MCIGWGEGACRNGRDWECMRKKDLRSWRIWGEDGVETIDGETGFDQKWDLLQKLKKGGKDVIS